jgi:microcystin-dependent protein
MAISQNQALFAILGTTYGGDGVQTFALPDLRGRGAVHQGQGLGLSNYVIGEVTGAENRTLLTNNLPAHTHLVNASTVAADQASPAAAISAAPQDGGGAATEYTKTAANATLAANALAPAGSSLPFSVLQPLLCVSFIIALNGIFPSRN